jgi:hypothetical protein
MLFYTRRSTRAGSAATLIFPQDIRLTRFGFDVTSCAAHRTRGHRALSAMLTVSQLSKSFAGRALFDDVSLQVNRRDRIGLVGKCKS